MGWRNDLLRPSGARSGALGNLQPVARNGIVVLALAAMVLGGASAQAAPRWFAPLNLSASGQDAFSPQVAATPQGGSVAVWVRSDGTNPGVCCDRIQAAVRAPGQSFSAAPITTLSGSGDNGEEPQVAVNPMNGDAYVVWTRTHASTLRVQISKHPNGGSWETPQTLSSQDGFAPQIAVDRNGNAFAVWTRFVAGTCCDRIESAARSSAQTSFGAVETLSIVGQEAFEPQITVDPNGNAVAIWSHQEGPNLRIEVARRLDFTQFTTPIGASPSRVALVPAFVPCGTSGSSPTNATHKSPLTGSACSPPVPSSSLLAVGGRSVGFTRNIVLAVGQCAVFDSTKCYPDFTQTVNVTDVRNGSPTGTDFVGKVAVRFTIRITDLFSSDGPATVVDMPFAVPATCTATTDTTIGSTCSALATANSLLPGAVRAGNRAIIEFGQIKIRDAGPNGTGYGSGCPPVCGDGDEQDFEVQGVFAP